MRGPEFTRRAALAMLAGAASATTPGAQGLPAALDISPGREKRLHDAAKGEGEVVVYSTAPPDDNKAFTTAFEARYGVPVKLWRSSSEDILTRAIAEFRAGRTQADVFLNTGVGLETLYREKQLQSVTSPHIEKLVTEAMPAHRQWAGVYLAPMVHLYNTNLIKQADLPKTWDDLLDARWKDKLAVEAADFDWFQLVVERIGREKGLALFRDIAQRNKVSVRKGHSLLANLVVAGEVPLALTTYQFTVEQLRLSGAPVDWFVIGPAVSAQVGVAIPTAPRHPNAALLFYDFLLSEGQDIMEKRHFITTRKESIAGAKIPIEIQDAAHVLDNATEWEDLYRKTFGFK